MPRHNKTQYVIRTFSVAERIFVIDRLRALGYCWHGVSKSDGQYVEREYSFNQYPYVLVRTDNNHISGAVECSREYGKTTLLQVEKWERNTKHA